MRSIILIMLTVTGLLLTAKSLAGTVTLTNTDAMGYSSFNTGLNWNNGLAPTGGNAYFTANFTLRTPGAPGSYGFGGDSLSLDTGGGMNLKTSPGTNAIPILILNGGTIANGNGPTTLAGEITNSGSSSVIDVQGYSRPTYISAAISGAGTITELNGVGSGAPYGVVFLSASNAFSGQWQINDASNRIGGVKSIVNLTNGYALGQATLTLGTTNNNSLQFSPTIGTFTLGSLGGTGSFSLTDTLSGNITLQVGNNNGSTSYSGVMSGGGGVTKIGSGAVTLTGMNTYSGATLVNQGTLVGVVGGSCSNSAVTVAATAGNTAALSVSVTNNAMQWTCSSLTVNNAGASSGLDFNLGSINPGTTVAPLNVTGTALFITTPTVTVELGGNSVTSNTAYPLVAWASQSGPTPTAVSVVAPGAVTGHLTVSGNTLYLVIDSAINIPANTLPGLVFTNVLDYGFMFWSNGPASYHYGIKTSRYGMVFNWTNLTPTTLFPIANPSPESAVLTESWAASFPAGSPGVSLSCQVVTNGVTNNVGTLIANTALIECGKYFQRRWQKIQAAGLPLDTNRCGLEVAAWPDRLSFVLRLAPSNTISSATLQMKLTLTNLYNTLLTSGAGGALQESNGTGFVFLPSAGSSAISYNPTNATVMVTTAVTNWQTSQQGSVGLVIYPVATNVAWTLTNAVATEASPLTLAVTPVLPAGGSLAVNYDTDRGWYDVSLPASGTAGDNGILRAQVTVTNNSPTPRVARINFDGVPFYIPGITAMLRDVSLNPVGIPVQLSKDWDTPSSYPMFANQWFHGLTMLTVPPNTNLNLELTLAGQNWGGVPAATHSQLCEYGYGNGNQNQQWDEAALGNYGESLTYDVEHVLTDNDGADSRPILLLTTNGSKGGWCINLGGADFLRYYDSGGTQRQHRRMRTQYARYCPNLTQVTYAGQTDDGKMALSYSASLARSDDYTRGLHQLTINVNSNLSFNRLVFFQMPGDSYAYNNGTNLAYGYSNQTNTVREWSAAPSGQNKNVGLAVVLTNSQPWISIHSLVYSGGDSSYSPGVKGYIIRSWKARINGVDNVPPYLVEHSLASGYIGSTIDIVPPPSVTTLQAGDYVQAVIERIYLPSGPGEYYGPDINLATAATNYANTYKMVLREAIGNNLSLNISAGMLVQTYPIIVIGVTNDFAQFSVTGGLNYVPVTFTGVSTYQNPLVEELEGTSWSFVNQAVNGNDFWQADYNSTSLNWDITFNLKLGSTNYQDISALQSSPVTRTFRFRNPNTVTSMPSVPVVFTNASSVGGSAGGGDGASGFQISGSGPAGQSWRLFTTTNLALPWAQWTLETSNTFPGNGQFNYTSRVSPNALQQFYRMVSP